MRILFLTTHFNAGGITSYVLSLAKGFVQKGHHVCVVTSGGNKEEDLAKISAEHVCLDMRTKSELSYKVFSCLPKLIRLAKQGHYDIIHAQTRVTQVMAALISLATKIPYVATCHGFFKPRFFRKIFPCWGKVTIAISQQVQEHLIRDFVCDPKKVFLVPHGICMDEHSASEEERAQKRKALGLKAGPTIGILARLSEVKGQDILIRAMKDVLSKFPDANLIIAGEGKTERALRLLTQELCLEDNVFFLSAANGNEQLLSLFDLFVMPSRQEGLGLAVMEAQAQGLAVIASRVGGIPSLIEHGKTGLLVSKESPQELAAAIIYLLENPTVRAQLGQGAKIFVKGQFSFAAMIDRTLQVYARCFCDEKNTRC